MYRYQKESFLNNKKVYYLILSFLSHLFLQYHAKVI